MTTAPRGMRVSLHLNSHVQRASDIRLDLRRTAVRADQAGVSALALMDHFLHPAPQPTTDTVLEGYTALGFLAASTEFMDLMLLVSGVTHRHPVLLAKSVTTIDVLSAGRARLGIGAGWFEAENHAYGMPFPSAGERFTMLEETLEIIRLLWSSGDGPYTGEHFQLHSTTWSPMPIRPGHPPIIIGGNGRRQTLRLAARYGDGCNILVGPDMGGIDEARSLISTLHEHCIAIDRDPADVGISILFTAPIPTGRDGAEQFAAEMHGYAELGVSEVFVMPLGKPDVPGFIDELGTTIIPAVAQATADI